MSERHVPAPATIAMRERPVVRAKRSRKRAGSLPALGCPGTDMPTIVGIAGSLRRSSYNAALLRAAVELAPPGLSIEVASIRDFPVYDGDVEAEQGVPERVQNVKERIAAADGLLLVTPEYNNSLPGVFKNAIDWLSRPPKDVPRVFGGRPVAIMGATPGPGGTILAQAAWLPVLRTLGTELFAGPRVYASNAAKAFDMDGRLVDEVVRGAVAKHLAGFSEFIARVGRRATGSSGR